MIQRTRCNYCVLKELKQRFGDRVTLHPLVKYPKKLDEVWTGVYVDDVRITSMLEIPDKCVCGYEKAHNVAHP